MINFKKQGFTLAEILITLTIIGVIAALTLPTLIANMQRQALETQLKKFHNQLTTGIKNYMAQNELPNMMSVFVCREDEECARNMDEFVTSTFDIVGAYDPKDGACFADKYKHLNGEIFEVPKEFKCYKLADGTVFEMGFGSWGTYVDLNGPKKPNTQGLDFWYMSISGQTGAVDEKYDPRWRKNAGSDKIKNMKDQCLNWGGYGGCFGYVLRNNFKFDW